ncbi:hypothetical protein [Motilibacter deserti]|uniref:WXG100 family type VII secretion target n=1 Tax=Motilibacter deserti TaxID=2714956 RepID=A0ABX0GY62_9ACTN|nr:hypothetical protein [Motilibacter deserti]NHC14534.1 hypothetical protein [Motilibacter deserti]
MTARPRDWSPLALVDPVPGDAAAVESAAVRMGTMAAELEQQARRLRRLATPQTWEGEAGREFRSAATDLAEDLERLRGRYEAAAGELRTWSRELSAAQDDSLRALRAAQDVEAAAATSSGAAAGAAEAPDLAVPRRMLEDAVARRDAAARRAAHAIEQAMHDDGLRDSWLQRFAGAHPVVVAWMKVASEVAALAGLALALVAVTTLAAVPAAVLLILAGLGLVVDGLLWGMGEGDGLSVVLGVVNLATAGLGVAGARVLADGWGSSVSAAKGVARERAEDGVRAANAAKVSLAERTVQRARPGGAAHARARSILADVDARARHAGDVAAAGVGQPASRPGLGRRLWTFDRASAQQVAAARWFRDSYRSSEVEKAYARMKAAAWALGGSGASGVSTEAYDRWRQKWATSAAPWKDAWGTVRTAAGADQRRRPVTP